MSEQRGRQRSREQTLYGETSPQEPSSSPVRKSNPDVKRNKRIANGKLESCLRFLVCYVCCVVCCFHIFVIVLFPTNLNSFPFHFQHSILPLCCYCNNYICIALFSRRHVYYIYRQLTEPQC